MLWKTECAVCPVAEGFLFPQGGSCTVNTQIPSRQEAKKISDIILVSSICTPTEDHRDWSLIRSLNEKTNLLILRKI